MNATLPGWLETDLNNPPKAGAGVHAWLFLVARQLHAHFPAVEIVRLLESRVANCGRHVPHNEIVSAVQNALGCAWAPGQSSATNTSPESKWPKPNPQRVREITVDGPGLCELWECSPVRIEDNAQHTEEIVDRLFPGNPLLCCGRSSREFNTKLREQWRGQLAQVALIVPSPMATVTGQTKEGRQSTHTLSNTGARRFLVVEFDQGTADEHAALLLHLATFAPMVCALHSGGKSMHGWFFVEGQPDDKVLKFFRYAVSLGADSRLWTRSQFCRMPEGTRDNGKRQTVFFLSFKPLKA